MNAQLAAVRLHEVLRIARSRNASDVHLCAHTPPAMRVDGRLEAQQTLAPSSAEIEALTAALLPERALAELARTGDASVAQRVEEIGSIRVHAYRGSLGTALAVRLLAPAVPRIESLQLPPVVTTFAQRTQGLIIFAGPTGSGKSTAAAALVDCINRTQAKHIITIEDPVEYEHAPVRCLVNQREVGRDVGSFVDATYGALRSDPDVMLIGEMRDPGTIRAALVAAETGHLVITTLHTGDAAQTVDRIAGAFDGGEREQIRLQLAQALAAVVCLRLVPRASAPGRLCAAEILIANDAARTLIRDGKTHQLRNVISTGRQAGMQTLEAHLSDLVARREVTLQAARLVTERAGEVRPAEEMPA